MPKLDPTRRAIFYDVITSILLAPGMETLAELGSNATVAVKKMAKAIASTSRESKKVLSDLAKDFAVVVAQAAFTAAKAMVEREDESERQVHSKQYV